MKEVYCWPTSLRLNEGRGMEPVREAFKGAAKDWSLFYWCERINKYLYMNKYIEFANDTRGGGSGDSGELINLRLM
jgi:hypothetical protein